MDASPPPHPLYEHGATAQTAAAGSAAADPSPPHNRHHHHLLVVPHSDVFGRSTQQHQQQQHQGNANPSSSSKPSPPPQLLLVQLPSTDWKAHDLKDARLVAFPNDNKPASLVLERSSRNSKSNNKGGQSFALHKVETSNAWVLGPPPTLDNLDREHINDEKKTENDDDVASEPSPRSSKRPKTTTTTTTLTTTRMRLLQQGSGASFLELRPHVLVHRELYRLLKKTLMLSEAHLAAQLGVSRHQVQQAVRQSPLCHVVTTTTKTATMLPARTQQQRSYGLWNATLLQDVETALVATLTEEYPDFCAQLPPVDTVVTHVLERLSSCHENNDLLPSILTHWLQQHLYVRDEQGHEAGRVAFVARMVAKALFRSKQVQTEDYLWDQWRLEWPGTTTTTTTASSSSLGSAAGDVFQPAFLQGLAVRRERTLTTTEGGHNDTQAAAAEENDAEGDTATTTRGDARPIVEWVYLPVEDICHVPLGENEDNNNNDNVSTALSRLAKRVEKTEWTKDELEPYAQALAAWFGLPGGVTEVYSKCQPGGGKNDKGQDVLQLPTVSSSSSSPSKTTKQ